MSLLSLFGNSLGLFSGITMTTTLAIKPYVPPTPALTLSVGPYLSMTSPTYVSQTVAGVILDVYALEEGYAGVATGNSPYGHAVTDASGNAILTIPSSTTHPVTLTSGAVIFPIWMIRATYPSGAYDSTSATSKIITQPIFN